MTLRTRPIITVTVTKKPDGRLVLNYTRTTVPASSQSEEVNSRVASVEGPTTLADTGVSSPDTDPRGCKPAAAATARK